MRKQEAREILMTILFELDMAKALDVEYAEKKAEDLLKGHHIEDGKLLLKNIIENIHDIDSVINEASNKWKTSRMPKVDLAIMRLAVGEDLYTEDVPRPVIISEAVNLAHKYSTDNSNKYVHGVLGKIFSDEK